MAGRPGRAVTQPHDAAWVAWFRGRGHPDAEPLASGMEGAVYRLGRGLVGKVWGGERPLADLVALRRFHDELSAQALPFATPEVVEVAVVDGTPVTVERELPGRPLPEVGAGATRVGDCLALVLEGLATVPDLPSAHDLPVLSEDRPFRAGLDWGPALAALLRRRVERFGDQLRAAVPGFDELFAHLAGALDGIDGAAGVVHGDVCPENVLVDGDLRPTALVDWGFLTTAGDPAFDASIAAGVVDMYGPDARAVDDRLTGVLARRLAVPVDRLLVYRAAYAVATSNAYDPGGRDGHFAWCASTLRRGDVREALGMPG